MQIPAPGRFLLRCQYRLISSIMILFRLLAGGYIPNLGGQVNDPIRFISVKDLTISLFKPAEQPRRLQWLPVDYKQVIRVNPGEILKGDVLPVIGNFNIRIRWREAKFLMEHTKARVRSIGA